MKEAFLMGILAMGANANDGDVNLIQVNTPVTVTQNGEQVTILRRDFVYAITANDTKAANGPQAIRHNGRPP